MFPPNAAPQPQMQPQGMPQAGMPQAPMPPMGAQGGGGSNPLIAELDNRLRGLSPQELQNMDELLSRADPQLLQLIAKIFPEMQQALMVLGQMGGEGGQQMPNGSQFGPSGGTNPLTMDGGVSPGLTSY